MADNSIRHQVLRRYGCVSKDGYGNGYPRATSRGDVRLAVANHQCGGKTAACQCDEFGDMTRIGLMIGETVSARDGVEQVRDLKRRKKLQDKCLALVGAKKQFCAPALKHGCRFNKAWKQMRLDRDIFLVMRDEFRGHSLYLFPGCFAAKCRKPGMQHGLAAIAYAC